MLLDQSISGPGPAYERLAATLRAEINAGRLRPGDRLPPSRTLAEELGLSRWVITEAYDQLKAEGYLAGRVGSGTVVAGATTRTAPPEPPAPARTAPAGKLLDLSPALPDLGSFPRSLWRAAISRALAGVSDDQLGHPEPFGAAQLRHTVADYLRRVRALDAAPDQVQVSQGVGNAVWLICSRLRATGARRVAVEDPSWPRLRQIAGGHGLEVVPVAVDRDGLRVADLVAHDRRRRIDAVFAMPTHQFPTGVPLSAERRLALLEWAASSGRWIVEDDYDAEFRYDRRPVGALAALAPDRVVYLGSVSKTLSPALHLGWMVAPPRLARGIAEARDGLGAMAPTLDQLALVDLIASGSYDRHLRRMRRIYQDRRRALLAALLARVPGSPAPSMDAGLHVLWRLPPGTEEAAVLAGCRAAGLSLLGESQCRVLPGPPGLVLGYGNLPVHRVDQVARTLAAQISTAQSSAAETGR